MNMPIISQFSNAEQSMTSLEIAELVQSRHDKVKQSIERLAERGVIAQPPMGSVVKTINNRDYETEVCIFRNEQGKRDSIVVVAQLCPEFTARLVDRWQELENKVAFDIHNPAHLLQAIEIQAKKNIQLTTENQVLTKAIQNITATENGVKFQQACKILNVKQADLAKWLRAKGWDRYINKSRASTHYSQERGYCETKFEEVDGVKPSGEPYNYTKIEFFILPKGMAVLAKHFGGEA